MAPVRPDTLPLALAGTPLAGEFRYWRGVSGRRYLHRIFPLELARDFRGCPLMLVRVDEDGIREVVWGGCVEELDGETLSAAALVGATEAHVHLLAESEDLAGRVADDLRAALVPGIARAA